MRSSCRGIRTRHARRRHHARLQLPDHAFGDVRFLAGLRDVERREREAAGAILVAIVVATRTVLFDEAVVIGGRCCGYDWMRNRGLRRAAIAVTSPRHNAAVPRESERALFIPEFPTRTKILRPPKWLSRPPSCVA